MVFFQQLFTLQNSNTHLSIILNVRILHVVHFVREKRQVLYIYNVYIYIYICTRIARPL